MIRSLLLLVCLCAAVALAGCQCCSKTEAYGDFIDDVNDHSFCMDDYYRASWDLTRIGHSDWCESELNQKWCSLGCGRCSQCKPSATRATPCNTPDCPHCQSHTIEVTH